MIQLILSRLGWGQADSEWDTIGLFMEGLSIPALSAGAADIIERQRQIEAEIRAYIEGLERENTELRNVDRYL